MAEVKDFYRLFEKRLLPLVRNRSTTDNEKLLFYLRIYTYLLNSLNLMSTSANKRSFNFLKIVAQLTAKQSFRGEEYYLKYINSIAREIISNESRIKTIVSQDPAADPLHSNTKLIMAQNICLMRTFKLAKMS